MRAMCDTHLAGHSRYSYEYEAPQVAQLLSREVFRLHVLLEYIERDKDRKFLGASWQELKRLEDAKLIPSTWFPTNDGILGTCLILNMMVISMAQ
jgi:hypothetical protein